MKGYCRTCKGKKELKDTEIKTTKKGVRYCLGTCPTCKRKISVMLKKDGS